jgi:NAD+ kinase
VPAAGQSGGLPDRPLAPLAGEPCVHGLFRPIRGGADVAREVLVVLHSGRGTNLRTAAQVASKLAASGIRLRVLADEWAEVECRGLSEDLAPRAVDGSPGCADGAEVVLVLGGDGTLLRAAEMARPAGTPLLGVNLGHVGFLAETEEESLDAALDAIIDGTYAVEERMTIDAVIRLGDRVLTRSWALNEVAVEKGSRERILEVVLEVDGRPVSGFGCDGVLCATPTGSTAYAFSAGGPLVWPQVEALLLVPSNAHALFARPMVISPKSQVAIEVDPHGPSALLDCDGRRTVELPPGARVELARGAVPVRMVRLDGQPFADRLVRKFDLPVRGWRGAPRPDEPRDAGSG